MIIYRIIKYEGSEEDLKHQLDKSVMPGFRYTGFSPGITITVKDRLDDPNERGFFADCKDHHGILTRQQYYSREDDIHDSQRTNRSTERPRSKHGD